MVVTDPARLPLAFAAAFNAGDPVAVEELFEPGAVFVTSPGALVSGAARRSATGEFLALGVPIEISVRQVYVAGDLALVIGDFVIAGVARDGTSIKETGTAVDVARRGADGGWRYVIDNPSGTGR